MLVLGTLRLREHDRATVDALMGAWLDVGGNVVDCAHEYGEGSSERAVGAWLEANGRRDDVVIVSKGCHPYDGRVRVAPQHLAADIDDSLRRLRTDRIDLYLLHRDDQAVAVEPLLLALEEHRRAGVIGAYGASNWTTGRLQQARDAADRLGLEGFRVSSPHLSLAVPDGPPYPGAVSACDAASRVWYAVTRLPMLAWSAQAGGFFVEPPPGIPAPAVSPVYRGAQNDERRRRARELAGARGCETNAVALAWVLRQPFPTFAVIGPDSVAELHSSLAALDVELSDEDVRWLNMEAQP